MNSVLAREVSIRDIVRLLNRRRSAFLVAALVTFSLAISLCLVMTRRYQAQSTIELQKDTSADLGLSDLMGSAGGEAGAASDALSVNIDLQTQAAILQSESLELKVIKDLDLEKNKDFQPNANVVSWVMSALSPKGVPDPQGVSIYDAPARRAKALKIFNKHLKVAVVPGTRLLEVSFSNRDPKVASAVVNDLVHVLIDYTFQTKFAATTAVSNWLEGQLGDLRKQSEELQTRVVEMQKNTELFGAGATDLQGKPEVYSPILDRLQQSTALLSQAEINTVVKGAIYRVAQTGSPELISQLSGTSMATAAGPGVANSLALLQSLRQQEAVAVAQIDQDSSQFGSNYPKLVQERASLKGIEAEINQEIHRVGNRAKNDYQIALAAEAGAQKQYDTDKAAAEKLNDKTVEYTILETEADDSHQLYQDLLKHLKEAGILEGLHSTSITVVDPARPPARPNAPNVPLYLAIGFGMGIFMGICSAFTVESLDNKIHGTEEIEASGLPLLGIIPKQKATIGKGASTILDLSNSPFGEAMRGLRSTLLMSRSGKPPKVILVTSTSPAEGKSTLSLNLALLLVQLGKKVLLLEADMRRPVMRRRLHIEEDEGLSLLLTNANSNLEPISIPDHLGLFVVPGGRIPPYPVELLGSTRFQSLLSQWQEQFDFIIMDSPPVLPVSDVQLLVRMADATVLIARSGYTSRLALERTYKLLIPHVKEASTPAIGVVLNFVPLQSAAYYGYYGYYGGKKYEYNSD